MLRFIFLIIMLMVFLPEGTFSQISSAGTEFRFAFIQNRIDRHGAPTSSLLDQVLIAFYISNNNYSDATVEIDFNGDNIQYEIDGNIISTSGIDNIHTFTISYGESKRIMVIPVETVTYLDVSPGGDYVTVPDSRKIQLMNNGSIQNKVFTVKSLNEVPLKVFAESTQGASRDAGLILPAQSLDNEYYVFSYDPYPLEYPTSHYGGNFGGPSEIGIVAVEEGVTEIYFKFPTSVTSSMTAWSNVDANDFNDLCGDAVHAVTLNKGEAYQIQSDNFDLTGTHIWSDGPSFAVFSGNMAVDIDCSVSSNVCGRDYIYEQMIPVKTWGNKYIITPLNSQHTDVIRIIAGVYGATIYKDGQYYVTLGAGESVEFNNYLSDPMYIYAEPRHIGVVQYSTSSEYDGSYHDKRDPSMIVLSPLEQSIEEISFSVLPESDWDGLCTEADKVKSDLLNIVAKTSETDYVFIDDFINSPQSVSSYNNIVTPWTIVGSNQNYSYCILDISNNSSENSVAYKLYMDTTGSAGFNAYVYGFDCTEAYGYCAGLNLIKDSLNNIGSNSFSEKDLLIIYPNPSYRSLTVELNNVNEGVFEIYNITGSKIYIMRKQTSQNQIKIDISGYPSGLYNLVFRNKNFLISEKFIVLKK